MHIRWIFRQNYRHPYETLITQLRQVNAEVLAAADELSHGTINTMLAKSDLELGIEALMRGMQS